MNTTNEHDCCRIDARPEAKPAPKKADCPRCGKPASRVDQQTVDSLVVESQRSTLSSEQHYYCTTADCGVVYFAPGAGESHGVIEKEQLRVRVGLKETEDPIAVCYCFGHTRASIADEIRETGSTDVVERVRAEVSAGRCSCEVSNPSGKCCLGELTRTAKELREKESS